MAREVGIGLLGAGWMGEVHSTAYRRVPIHFPECAARALLVVAADQDEERAHAAAERLGYEHSTTDWREVIADPDVEAVSICAPNFLHRDMAIAAAEAGKHFWGEKPLGSLPEDTIAIAEAAESADVRTIVGLNYRHPPAVQHARRLLAEGTIGGPNHFRMQFLASYSANPRGALSWRFSRELSGHGILSDLGSHAVDLAQFLLGPIVRTSATSAILIRERPKVAMGTGTHFSVVEGDAEMGVVDNEDWAAALVEFESGLRGTIELSRVALGADARYAFEVSGTRGAVRWDFERMGELELHLPLATGDSGYARIVMGPGHPEFARFQPGAAIAMGYDDLKVIEARLFLQSIADGRQREPGVREIASTARVIAAAARSFETGAWESVER
ncbi:MAG: Gfo/Idh/MocA family oxidoreductase [Actinomycetota bacterium]|nr:Gfo/Idh/MocA family oxidoreductase [Actinomycetota bacterium]